MDVVNNIFFYFVYSSRMEQEYEANGWRKYDK